jgi:hypothetical protein
LDCVCCKCFSGVKINEEDRAVLEKAKPFARMGRKAADLPIIGDEGINNLYGSSALLFSGMSCRFLRRLSWLLLKIDRESAQDQVSKFHQMT